ncbi:hypothetical protein OC709_02280 ['Planchonia careya' phytoplasma]|nr:hypothetical protein ['Planchonia careya' phytoplasma]MDO8030326.1 hypothetical protein ['Planchonia careya' phytoplasma]
MLEIKFPLNKDSYAWKDFFTKKIIPPSYYWAQIQCGLYCSESQKAYFFFYFQEDDYFSKKVFLDEKFILAMLT